MELKLWAVNILQKTLMKSPVEITCEKKKVVLLVGNTKYPIVDFKALRNIHSTIGQI